jgi:hypothetical protein
MGYMVRRLPKLRCPVCGKLSFLPSFVGFHKIDSFILKIKGLGRGKGFRNTYERATVKGSLIDYWIKRLEEVINWLKNQKKVEISYQIKHPDLSYEKKLCPVSENSVSMEIPLMSNSIKTATLNVPNSLVSISYPTKKSILK